MAGIGRTVVIEAIPYYKDWDLLAVIALITRHQIDYVA